MSTLLCRLSYFLDWNSTEVDSNNTPELHDTFSHSC